MCEFNKSDFPHRRYNPLTGEYVLVSPHRTKRPWQGKIESAGLDSRQQYDKDCYLCPGNVRANGEKNPLYKNTYFFTNDFSALLSKVPKSEIENNPLLEMESVNGACRVICFSPQHDLTLAEMSNQEIRQVVELWVDQIKDLHLDYKWIQIFENRGEIMGSSNPHPHGQVWAGNFLPNGPFKENRQQKHYYDTKNTIMLLDYVELELEKKERIVVENVDWVAVVPFWAVWPFETLLLPKRHVFQLTDLTDSEKNSLSECLKKLLTKYDNLFNVSFPYSMGWHGAPTDGLNYDHWQLHAHFYPPLLRSATVKKFLVGYEMLGEAQRDITAEQAAKKLRDLTTIHYKLQ
jgi:UDPglucose--hexose-1-phosphate uridylyltransferase